eukprot:6487530-Amphidinium_carterae.1
MCRERNTRDMWHVPDLRMVRLDQVVGVRLAVHLRVSSQGHQMQMNPWVWVQCSQSQMKLAGGGKGH